MRMNTEKPCKTQEGGGDINHHVQATFKSISPLKVQVHPADACSALYHNTKLHLCYVSSGGDRGGLALKSPSFANSSTEVGKH